MAPGRIIRIKILLLQGATGDGLVTYFVTLLVKWPPETIKCFERGKKAPAYLPSHIIAYWLELSPGAAGFISDTNGCCQ
ncbi:hypothetical protein B0H10DRAFT_1998066 [Mycena sp. CBHHK59/15]|nr:hypothetical protein B0H10DRAFT_1998066 [Mycena sp. CBHHK59/15]